MTLTMHQLREIAARIAAGESPTMLAEEFGVPSVTEPLAALTASLGRRGSTAGE